MLVWVVAGLAAGGVAAPARAATCSGNSGVSVIVDFGSSIRTGCAAGDPASAWTAIEGAGFALEGTQRFPATFICRVAGYPSASQEACVQTPPASAYWALWSAPAGGSWTYASSGAASIDPAPGSAIGLAFGAGRTPGMAPPDGTPTTPPPATTSRPTSTTSSTPRTATAAGSTSAVVPTRPATSAPTTTWTEAATAARGSTSAGGAATTATAPSEADSSSSAAIAGSASSPEGGLAASAATGDSGSSAAVTIGTGAGIGILLVLGASVVRRQRDRAARG